jgi:tRNA pseudouridine38-40 synthase
MPRYKLTIEYDGTPFSGWQIQENGATVQGALEAAVKAICGEDVRVHGAGRTDAGVHALGQVAHCDIAKHFVPGRFRDGLNAHLRPHPIGVLAADIVPGDFEARFSAKKRHYLYRITNHRANLALNIGRTWRVPRALDTEAMHEAAQRLLGKHDFTTFATPSARQNRRKRPLTSSTLSGTAMKSASSRRRARSCTARCARWWDRWSGSAKVAGRLPISPPR